VAVSQSDSLFRVPQNSLADVVTAQLRAVIVAGQLLPGEKLTEPALAERLGVSRSPVREALKRLESLGLVRSRLNYSAYVWEPTEEDVDEIINLRNMIEVYATECVARALNDEDFERLEQIIAQQEHDIQTRAYLDLVRSDREFHEYMVRKAGNSRLVGWWDQIMGQWEVLVARRWRYDTAKVIPRVVHDHCLILDALKQRNLNLLLSLHRTINDEVCEETKRMLRVQALGADEARPPDAVGEEVVRQADPPSFLIASSVDPRTR
jgi:DNA-binding GntR family transcriptional regulator